MVRIKISKTSLNTQLRRDSHPNTENNSGTDKKILIKPDPNAAFKGPNATRDVQESLTGRLW
jgi:hypothetical protein